MYIYHIWCDIESGSDGIQFQIADPPLRLTFNFEDGGASTAIFHLCQGKNILILLQCEKEVERPYFLIQSIIQHTQGIFDAVLFSCGISGTVIGRAALLANGQLINIKSHDVKQVIDPVALNLSIPEITRCSIESPVIRTCLSDLRRASLNLQDVGMLSYRAVETIMQTYKTDQEEAPAKSWPRMRDDLRFEKSYVSPLVKYSVSNRHGKYMVVTREEAQDLLSRALTILGRFCKSAILKIPLTEEPILQ